MNQSACSAHHQLSNRCDLHCSGTLWHLWNMTNTIICKNKEMQCRTAQSQQLITTLFLCHSLHSNILFHHICQAVLCNTRVLGGPQEFASGHKWNLDQFNHFCKARGHDRVRPTYTTHCSTCSNKPHLARAAMQPNNYYYYCTHLTASFPGHKKCSGIKGSMSKVAKSFIFAEAAWTR